jgi:spore coat polysaccharide biosynthesis predicted glycosyltransferase SpsG/CMP-N-acetylneuraminic acid synthetase
MTSLSIFIPALKKATVFQDDLVKKLNGVTLVQRAINKAKKLDVNKKDIHLLTDSEEISLIAQRNDIGVYINSDLSFDTQPRQCEFDRYLSGATENSKHTVFISPYAPLLSIELLSQAIREFEEKCNDILMPVKLVKRQLLDSNKSGEIANVLGGALRETHRLESKAFTILKSRALFSDRNQRLSILTYEVNHDLIEIGTLQDWWVCEKMLQRKRIVFRVIGSDKVGMGHIYRALSLAHEITDHEILFVSDTDSNVAVNKLAGYEYWLGIYDPEDVIPQIIALSPDIVINDILSTTREHVSALKQKGIKVVNFEDLGSGSQLADLTINELYDEPQICGGNILWGHEFYVLRDEFSDATPHQFAKTVDNILIAMGGTDQHDLTRKIYNTIKGECKRRNIHIDIVAGGGYRFHQEFASEIEGVPDVTFTRETGVISKIMEKTQLAIVSNGRTVYELAHMNVPAIVVPQHEREEAHDFAREENGFYPLSGFKAGTTENDIRLALNRFLDDDEYRHGFYNKTIRFQFNLGKSRVLKKILSLI